VQVPLLLRQVIDTRLARLGEEAQRLLAVAAMIGQTVPLDLWQTVAEVDEDALLGLIEHAGEARVLMETTEGEAVRFLHALTRQALYEGIPAIRRKRLHRQIGEVIAVMPKAHPDTVAYHFRSAGDARATGWLVKAGWRAYRSFAYETAQSRFAETLTRIDGVERVRILRSRTPPRHANRSLCSPLIAYLANLLPKPDDTRMAMRICKHRHPRRCLPSPIRAGIDAAGGGGVASSEQRNRDSPCAARRDTSHLQTTRCETGVGAGGGACCPAHTGVRNLDTASVHGRSVTSTIIIDR